MNSQRLSLLLEYLKNDPNDPFNLYAIATEYRTNSPEKAQQYYEQLLEQHPEYLPTYYHCANLYIELDRDDEAESTFKKGIQLARAQGNSLALRELQNAYNEFLFDD
ncbi:tetratricopeptide repeat protein [Fulvivirga sp. M361]|nr:tetratricopeptide repeat protein [Fulvivirga sp. M361]